jgi:hypothetical protein
VDEEEGRVHLGLELTAREPCVIAAAGKQAARPLERADQYSSLSTAQATPASTFRATSTTPALNVPATTPACLDLSLHPAFIAAGFVAAALG